MPQHDSPTPQVAPDPPAECGAEYPTRGYFCGREPGHTGGHMPRDGFLGGDRTHRQAIVLSRAMATLRGAVKGPADGRALDALAAELARLQSMERRVAEWAPRDAHGLTARAFILGGAR